MNFESADLDGFDLACLADGCDSGVVVGLVSDLANQLAVDDLTRFVDDYYRSGTQPRKRAVDHADAEGFEELGVPES